MEKGNNNIYIGIIGALTLAVVGIGGYLLWKKKKGDTGVGGSATPKSESSSSETKTSSETEPKTDQPKSEPKNTGIGQPQWVCSTPVSLAGDNAWEYRKCDTFWQTRKKGSKGQWISLANNKTASSKLDVAFPKM